MKIWFFDLKNGFLKFLKLFLTHFDIQAWENDTVRLLWRSQKKFWDLQSKIGSIRLFQMFRGLIWYHSRGHTTKIDFGKRSRLKKKAKTPPRWTFWNNSIQMLTKWSTKYHGSKDHYVRIILCIYNMLISPKLTKISWIEVQTFFEKKIAFFKAKLCPFSPAGIWNQQ